MPQEIERKFLVTGEYKSQAHAQSRIVQGYISSARGRTVRVRIRDGKGYLTIKGPSDASGTARYEWERELPLEEAEELMRLCESGVIDKALFGAAAATSSRWTSFEARMPDLPWPKWSFPRPTKCS